VILAVREETLPKAIFPNSSPSSVRVVPLLRWAELTNILQKANMVFGTPTDGPYCVVSE
jgi:hypothetical protein